MFNTAGKGAGLKAGKECRYCSERWENICGLNVDLTKGEIDQFSNCTGFKEDVACIDLDKKFRRDHLTGEFEGLVPGWLK